jgi:hypothetical protein
MAREKVRLLMKIIERCEGIAVPIGKDPALSAAVDACGWYAGADDGWVGGHAGRPAYATLVEALEVAADARACD